MKQNYWKPRPQKILQVIEQADLKHWWVAEQVGIHRTTLRRWLRGDIQKIEAGHFHSLSMVLNCPAWELGQLHRGVG